MTQLIKNSQYTVTITGYTAEGAGVSRIDGCVVFIPDVLLGEECVIQIVKVGAQVAFGKLVQLIQPSPQRVASLCPAFPQCGGCDFWHMTYEEELALKTQRVSDALTRIGGFSLPLSPIVGAPETARYRNKAQFPVGVQGGRVVSGFFRRRSHAIIPTDDCLLQTTLANRVAVAVRAWMEFCGVPAYDEATHKGVIRHVFVRTGRESAVLCLVAARAPKAISALIETITRDFPEITGIVLNLNPNRTNVILGETERTLWGDPFVTDTLCGLTFRLAPKAFYQVNHAQAERLYQIAVDFAALDETQTALDLYCGAGTITLCLARHAHHVTGIEVVPDAIENAKENAARNGIENVTFLCTDASNMPELTPDVIVVDPPRKGLDASVVKKIAAMRPARVVYVSCDPATMARDAKLLCADGYTLTRAVPVDLFPRTHHVETCVLLSHKNS